VASSESPIGSNITRFGTSKKPTVMAVAIAGRGSIVVRRRPSKAMPNGGQ